MSPLASWIKLLLGVFCVCVGLAGAPSLAEAAADREKLLTEPGVYGTFATFRLDDTWMKQDQATRISQLTLFKGVVEQHREKVAIDLYLLRGLSDHADLMFRIHAAELRDTQQFLMDLQGNAFGKYLTDTGLMHGVTKKANYVPGFPDQLKADLKVASEPGPKPYAIVIPVRKNADWWALDQEKRAVMMREHTEATVPYLKTVKRKLYHSSGLDDLDFITYFETPKLEDFHSLILSLKQVKEFQYTPRFGHPTLIGTVKSLDEMIEALAQ
ncbi:MAG: chlorite dismutase family protein [Nitrospira sp.]|nr:chlorite dismutase family protein [Nitrospira sp.]